MPYLAHFGFKDLPFTLTPNTQLFFPAREHRSILEALSYAVQRNGGVMKVTGPIGTGKTMICRLLLRRLIQTDTVAYLNAPQCEPEALIEVICGEFDIDVGSRGEMTQHLNEFLLEQHSAGRNVVLVVDEAQALGREGLETVRLLSNLETDQAKLLQIVLFGQTELDDLLARSDLRQLAQRIVFGFETKTLSPEECRQYLQHRTDRMRMPGVAYPVFTEAATSRLVKASKGNPRVLNILADKALLAAYGNGKNPADLDNVRKAIAESGPILRAEGGEDTRGRWVVRTLWVAIVAITLVLAAAAAWIIHNRMTRLGNALQAPALEAPANGASGGMPAEDGRATGAPAPGTEGQQ